MWGFPGKDHVTEDLSGKERHIGNIFATAEVPTYCTFLYPKMADFEADYRLLCLYLEWTARHLGSKRATFWRNQYKAPSVRDRSILLAVPVQYNLFPMCSGAPPWPFQNTFAFSSMPTITHCPG